MNNIDRCKKAQELGLRVQFDTRETPIRWIDQKANGGTFAYYYGDECYRVHPDDEKAFENFLALEALLANQVETINCLVGERDQWSKAHVSVRGEAVALRIENERLKNAATDTSKDPLAQLRNQLAPNETAVIYIQGV